MAGIDDRLRQAGPLEWYVLDVEKGTYRLEASPQKVKAKFTSHQDLFNFKWRFKLDGNLMVESNQEASSKAPGKTKK